MDRLKLKPEYLNFIEKLFLYLFTAYAILSSNSFTYGTKVIGLVMWPSFVLGAAIILYRVLHFKNYYKMTGFIGLIAMLGSLAVSVLMNYKFSFKENVIICILWCFYLLVIYIIENGKNINKVIEDFELFAKFFVAYTLISSIVSFYLLLTGYAERIITTDTNYEYFRGFIIGRLWGTYINPNNGAVSAAISVLFLVFFICRAKKIYTKILCGVAIFLELMYIALSDSRSGAVCVGVAVAIFALVLMIYKWENKKVGFKILAVCLACVIGVVGFIVPRKLKDGYNNVSVAITEYMNEHPSNDAGDGDEEKDKDKFELNVVDRGYDLSDDVSNRRFDVWFGGVQAFLESPKTIIMGYSFKGFTEQVQEKQPDNYLVNNDFTIFTTLDNEVINILVAQGLLGILATVAFVVMVLINIIKNWFKQKKENQIIIAVLTGVIIALSTSSMFGSMMFYHFSPNTIAFWFVLGSLMYVLKMGSKVNNDETSN